MPTPLQVDIDPDVGGHSAILNFDDPSSPGIEFQTMNTVLAPYEFNDGNGFSQAVSGSVGRGQQLHYFFRVPAGTPAFRVDLDTAASTTPGTGQIRFLRWHPFGLAIESNAVSECYVPAGRGRLRSGRPAVADGHEPAGGCLGGHGRRTADVRCGLHAVHADRDDHRRDRVAEPGPHRDGGDRCARSRARTR